MKTAALELGLVGVGRDHEGFADDERYGGERLRKDRATVESRLPKAGGVSDLHTVWRDELAVDEQAAIGRCVGAVPSDATTGGRLPADDPELRRHVVAGLEHQRSWWNRTHVYAEVAKRIDTAAAETDSQRRIAQSSPDLGSQCLLARGIEACIGPATGRRPRDHRARTGSKRAPG